MSNALQNASTLRKWRADGDNILGTAARTLIGRNGDNLGRGLQVGGAEPAFGEHGVLLGNDGHATWLRFQPSRNEQTVEMVVYPSSSQGIAVAGSGTNQITRTRGTPFTTAWIGRRFYFGENIYTVATVPSVDLMTVTQLGGGAVSFASSFSETYHFGSVYGSGTCNVSGTTVTRVSGDPFIPFIAAPFVLRINGTARTVSSFTDISTLVLSAAPGDATSVPYTFEVAINDQLATFRLQKLLGSDEENVSLYVRYDGYWLHTLYAGGGKYRRLVIGSGEISGGVLARQLVAQPNGDLTIGGDYDYEAIRVLNLAGAVNRLETQGAATGISPAWRARGADSAVGMGFDTKGIAGFSFTGNSFSRTLFQIFGSTTGTSWLAVAASDSETPGISANGAATHIHVQVTPKGANGHMVIPNLPPQTYANDAAAAAGGCPVGGVYHHAGAMRVRLT